MIAKKNLYPYFLWLTTPVKCVIKNDYVLIKNRKGTDSTKFTMKKVPNIKIFLMKHFPAFILAVYLLYMPIPLSLFIGFSITSIGLFFIKYYYKLFKIFVLLMCLGGLYLVYIDLELLFEDSLYVVVEIILFFFIFREIYVLIREDKYYYIKEIDSITNINRGCYLRVKKEDICNVD